MENGLKTRINILILFLFLLSCNKNNEVKSYYSNGNLKSVELFNNNGKQEGESKYYKENGKLDYSTFYNDGEIFKSIIYYSNGNMHYYSELGYSDTIKKISYYENGKIEMIGNIVDEKRVGFWKKYDTSKNLIEEYEFLVIEDKEHLNQFKKYDKNGKILKNESSFFTLNIPDTIQIGKNIGKLNYFSFPNDDTERYLYVIIDNKYEDRKIKKDTFYILGDKNNFGIYAYKKGSLTVKGKILDRKMYTHKFDKEKNSIGLEFKDHFKYFKKEIYVTEKTTTYLR